MGKALNPAVAGYLADRNRALFSLDKKTIEEFMGKYHMPIPLEPDVFWGSVYKSVVNIPGAPEDVVKKAKMGLADLHMDESIALPKEIRVVRGKAGN